MKSLEEILKGVEAFVEDMEELGVDVKVSIAGDPMKLELRPGVTLLAVVKKELGENLEAEGGG